MRNRNKNIFKILAVFLALTFLILYNSTFHYFKLRIELTDAVAPLLEGPYCVVEFIRKMIPFASLRYENKLLKQRLELVHRKLVEAKFIYKENERLKELLNFKKSLQFGVIPAEVIGRDPSNWANSAIINKGSRHGIRQGKAVLSTKGLIGRTVAVGRFSAKILLISDMNSKIGALIQRTREGGILAGQPDGRLKLIYLALDSNVARGDKVISAGFGAVFPKNILIGEVTDVGREPGRLYKIAMVKPAEDLARVEEVLCIK